MDGLLAVAFGYESREYGARSRVRDLGVRSRVKFQARITKGLAKRAKTDFPKATLVKRGSDGRVQPNYLIGEDNHYLVGSP
jgi:hypothetical protein